ncbi:carbonic anhydrase 1-like isoform X5 [Ornithodoros turicata]|uniref:carbonic anhydrase 1-like isoform X5 n=1 Tax=Ornithodoros turicata TaxID=34597 RepID=UPI00313A1981
MNKRRPVELLSLTLLLHACTRTEPAEHEKFTNTYSMFSVSNVVESLRSCGMDEWGYTSSFPADCTSSTVSTPDTWPATFPLCGGSMQSPVELRFLQSVYKPMSPMHFFNYDYEMALDVQIIGTNLLLFPNSSRLAVFGGPLKVEYTFVMGAFHFGKGEFDGSEHKIDSTGYAAELQLIHYTETNIGINCFKGVNGLLALAILFKFRPTTPNWMNLYRTFHKCVPAPTNPQPFQTSTCRHSCPSLPSTSTSTPAHSHFRPVPNVSSPSCSRGQSASVKANWRRSAP